MSYFSSISIRDSANLDAFSRLRTSNPENLFSTQTQYNAGTLQMETFATGTGSAPSHSANTRMVSLPVAAGSGTSGTQSFQYIPYLPSKSQMIAVTGVLGAGVANTTVDAGYFDSANGIILRQNGTSGLQLIRRTSTGGSVSDAATVDQDDWNLDPLNGNGPSGITFNEANTFILIIDLQFLGMGRVRVGFDMGGVIVYVHEFLNANVLTVPYMQTATLPVGMLVTATSSAAPKTAYFKCAAVNSEGGYEEGLGFSFSTPETTVSASSGARTHLVSIRPKTTFNGIANRELFFLRDIELLVTGAQPVLWELVIGQAITSPSWADINTAYSAFEYGTGTISGAPALVLASGYCLNGTGVSKGGISKTILSRYPITLDRAGAVRAMGTLSLIVTGIGGSSNTRAIVNFEEVR